MKIKTSDIPQFIDFHFRQDVLAHLNSDRMIEALHAMQQIHMCLCETDDPIEAVKLLRGQFVTVMEIYTQSNRPTKAVKACIDQLDIQLYEWSIPLRSRLNVMGSTKDLDLIAETLIIENERINIFKHADAPQTLSKEQTEKMLRGEIQYVTGTNRLELHFNCDTKTLKEIISKQFPNVTFS